MVLLINHKDVTFISSNEVMVLFCNMPTHAVKQSGLVSTDPVLPLFRFISVSSRIVNLLTFATNIACVLRTHHASALSLVFNIALLSLLGWCWRCKMEALSRAVCQKWINCLAS